MSFRSEIRTSVINNLEEKVASSNYGNYLRRLTLKKIRGFKDRVVSFDFPVTAVVGPNGGGKSTILGAASLPYAEISPGTFFAKSGLYDSSMKDWVVEYEVIDKKVNPKLPVHRTASFPQLKWNRKGLERTVLLFGVSRTVPATERKELVRAVGSSFVAKTEAELAEPVVDAVEKILGKDMQGCNRLSIDAAGRATIFAAETSNGIKYSEFHFGAGEASVIRIVSAIEDAPANTLILIEEIENGLHPVATQRIVEYLIDVANRKSCQVIFTTHSNDALAPLPSKAIWAAYNGEVLQGSSIFAHCARLRDRSMRSSPSSSKMSSEKTWWRWRSGTTEGSNSTRLRFMPSADSALRSKLTSNTTSIRPAPFHQCASLMAINQIRRLRRIAFTRCPAPAHRIRMCSTPSWSGSTRSPHV
ncbi:AAA family ATPase [Rhodococcus hoagii]|nr:AAA family ATPase [Prescottella equi]